MIKLSLHDGRYVVSSMDESGANWLRSFAGSIEQGLSEGDVSRSIDPRFINEFIDAAEAAGVKISALHERLHRGRGNAHRK